MGCTTSSIQSEESVIRQIIKRVENEDQQLEQQRQYGKKKQKPFFAKLTRQSNSQKTLDELNAVKEEKTPADAIEQIDQNNKQLNTCRIDSRVENKRRRNTGGDDICIEINMTSNSDKNDQTDDKDVRIDIDRDNSDNSHKDKDKEPSINSKSSVDDLAQQRNNEDNVEVELDDKQKHHHQHHQHNQHRKSLGKQKKRKSTLTDEMGIDRGVDVETNGKVSTTKHMTDIKRKLNASQLEEYYDTIYDIVGLIDNIAVYQHIDSMNQVLSTNVLQVLPKSSQMTFCSCYKKSSKYDEFLAKDVKKKAKEMGDEGRDDSKEQKAGKEGENGEEKEEKERKVNNEETTSKSIVENQGNNIPIMISKRTDNIYADDTTAKDDNEYECFQEKYEKYMQYCANNEQIFSTISKLSQTQNIIPDYVEELHLFSIFIAFIELYEFTIFAQEYWEMCFLCHFYRPVGITTPYALLLVGNIERSIQKAKENAFIIAQNSLLQYQHQQQQHHQQQQQQQEDQQNQQNQQDHKSSTQQQQQQKLDKSEIYQRYLEKDSRLHPTKTNFKHYAKQRLVVKTVQVPRVAIKKNKHTNSNYDAYDDYSGYNDHPINSNIPQIEAFRDRIPDMKQWLDNNSSILRTLYQNEPLQPQVSNQPDVFEYVYSMLLPQTSDTEVTSTIQTSLNQSDASQSQNIAQEIIYGSNIPSLSQKEGENVSVDANENEGGSEFDKSREGIQHDRDDRNERNERNGENSNLNSFIDIRATARDTLTDTITSTADTAYATSTTYTTVADTFADRETTTDTHIHTTSDATTVMTSRGDSLHSSLSSFQTISDSAEDGTMAQAQAQTQAQTQTQDVVTRFHLSPSFNNNTSSSSSSTEYTSQKPRRSIMLHMLTMSNVATTDIAGRGSFSISTTVPTKAIRANVVELESMSQTYQGEQNGSCEIEAEEDETLEEPDEADDTDNDDDDGNDNYNNNDNNNGDDNDNADDVHLDETSLSMHNTTITTTTVPLPQSIQSTQLAQSSYNTLDRNGNYVDFQEIQQQQRKKMASGEYDPFDPSPSIILHSTKESREIRRNSANIGNTVNTVNTINTVNNKNGLGSPGSTSAKQAVSIATVHNLSGIAPLFSNSQSQLLQSHTQTQTKSPFKAIEYGINNIKEESEDEEREEKEEKEERDEREEGLKKKKEQVVGTYDILGRPRQRSHLTTIIPQSKIQTKTQVQIKELKYEVESNDESQVHFNRDDSKKTDTQKIYDDYKNKYFIYNGYLSDSTLNTNNTQEPVRFHTGEAE